MALAKSMSRALKFGVSALAMFDAISSWRCERSESAVSLKRR
jgi:hypothetical protein